MSHLTRDKVVDEWLAEAELAVRAAQEVVEAAERELQAARERLVRLQAAQEVAAEADAVVREHAGEASAGTALSAKTEQAPVPKWCPESDLAQLPRDYPQIARVVKEAGAEGIRAIEVHRRLGWPDTDGSRQNVRNRLQRLTQKGWLRLVSRGVYAWAADA
ncbi:hypothetical protein JL475_38870 [Streptomyces sp. M2CJ-2]|uniref:hypothetical protein n=1 Tax=Streptomyces sp. M2CJ-2 TaxID=2803948 RepID=UPI00192863D3|nr:hypothetical protein [Streptomyces sp. M2CJ-2]MBL3671711.1 hypothetical protein [Streptomyces sp. M2CJ-2]